MSAPVSAELLAALTGQSAGAVQELLSTLPAEHRKNVEIVANRLEEKGWLTPYQAGHFSAGRGDALLVGQNVVLDELGHGSMGMVYKVRHRIMGRMAALKVFVPEADGSENHARFLREIQATAQLDHPNIIKAYEAGEHHGSYFLSMELIDGKNVQEIVEREGPIPVEQSLHIYLEAAKGLAHAHSLGMVHRDVKPGNIMVSRTGKVKVLDLGLVKFLKGISNMASSLDGTVRGTAAYMSPEQAISIRHADHRSDIYSLGCSLYFTLTSKPMFTEKTIMHQLLAHQKKPAPSLLATLPDLPFSIEKLYQRMVAKEQADRFQSMDDVVACLKAIQSGSELPTVSNATSSATEEQQDPPSSPWKRMFSFWREKT